MMFALAQRNGVEASLMKAADKTKLLAEVDRSLTD
jgi:hypothetical protein